MKRKYAEVSDDSDETQSKETCVIEKNIWTVRYKWKSEKFKNNVKSWLKSSSFSSGLKSIKDKWHLACMIKRDKVMIFLCLESLEGRRELCIKTKYTIVGFRHLERCVSPTIMVKALQPGSSINFAETSISKKILMDEKQNMLRYGGRLDIECEIQIFLDPEENMILNDKNQLGNDFAEILENEKYGDVVFKVGEKSLSAMKGILAVRSPTFAKIFADENQTNEITIYGINEEVFKELLFFIYTDTSPEIESMPIRLLVAAEKYQLSKLKTMCQEILVKKITVENVTRLSTLAARNKASLLKEQTIKFMKLNFIDVAQTDQFKAMQLSQNVFFVEIMDEVFSK